MSITSEFVKGLWRENPTFRIMLGMCPTLATTTRVEDAVGMGVAATFVLVMSNIFVSIFRKAIPSEVRIPCYVIIIATFVQIADFCLNAWAHDIYKSLGIFIPLIVVNCIILGRAEAFASKNGVLYSTIDGLGMGTGFTLALMILATVREILGSGNIFGHNILGANYQPILIMILPPGAFIGLGFLLATMNKIEARMR